MSVSIKNKTIKGIGWSAIDKVSRFSVTFIVSLVLARLLSPDDFGLLGLTTIFITISNTLINGGLVPSLVRKKETTEEDYNTVFIANLFISILLYIIIFFLAPYFAVFFGRIELTSLVRVSSLVLLIGSLTIIPGVIMVRRLDFKVIAKISIISALLSGIIGIIFALANYGVWSLVFQTISQKLISTYLILKYFFWKPRFKFYNQNFKDLFGFGWKLMLSNIVESMWGELNHVVVGKFYSPATLGQYTRSKQFSSIFSDNITAVIQRVTFPALSSIQDDRIRLTSAYRRIIKITMFISAIGMFYMAAISEPLIHTLIGEKWHIASTYLPLICISGSTYPLQAINLNLLQVKGRSDIFLGISIIKKIIGLFPLFVGAFVGIIPMLYANLIMTIVSFYLNSYYSGMLIGYSSRLQIVDVLPSYLVAVLIAIPVYFIKYMFALSWLSLIIQLLCGIVLFFVICEVLKPQEYKEVLSVYNIIKKKFR